MDDAVFGDGGAFPEVHVHQYPLSMGRKSASCTLMTLGATASDSKLDSSMPERPSGDAVKELMALTLSKLTSTGGPEANKPSKSEPTYIRYQPKQQNPQHNSGQNYRIIRMVDAQKDPLEPPKFRHKRVPRGPPSPPVPVVHSPPRKLSVKDMADWKIPPCISNWKNPKGYTIPLDKRLAADGRGLQETTINDNFAKLSEALYIAERNAREEVENRIRLAKQLASRQKQKKEEELRKLAMLAREERARGTTGAHVDATPAPEDQEGQQQRNELREEKRRQVEREKRLESRGKKAKDKDRDISETIALGGSAGKSMDAMYDTRLYNQSSGIGSGFKDDDEYRVYDNALFKSQSGSNYRPDKDRMATEEERTSKVDKHLKGLEFEKDDDPFGLGQILTEAKSKKRPAEAEASSASKRR